MFTAFTFFTTVAVPPMEGGMRAKSNTMYAAGNPAFVQIHLIMGVVTWLLFIAVLVALVRLLWKKGDKIK